MAVFEYRALNTQGKTLKGVIDASTPLEARAKLRLDGVFAYDLNIAELEKTTPQKKMVLYWFWQMD